MMRVSPQDQLRLPLLEEVVGLLDRIPDACAILDDRLTILYANQAFSRWLLGEWKSLKGLSFCSLASTWLVTDFEAWVAEQVRSASSGQRVLVDSRTGHAYEVQITPTSAGVQLVASQLNGPLHAANEIEHEFSGIHSSPKSWPESVSKEEGPPDHFFEIRHELQETQSRLQMAIDSARLGVWVRKLPGTIYKTNHHGRAHFGIFDDREVTSALYESCLSTEKVPLVYGVLDDLFPIESRRDSIHRVIGIDGRIRWIRAAGSIVRDKEGQPLMFQGVTMDITDQLARESELERRVMDRTVELHAALRESESFAYSASHDLRSPLRSIIATSRLLEEDYAPELSPGARELLDRQADSALRLADLIDALLDLSRVGRQAMVRVPLSVTALAEEVVSDLAGRNSTVKFEIEPNLETKADPKLLRLVFQNLIENSLKFSPGGGVIHVGRLDHHADQPFFVRDHGVGFDMAFADKLFQPFQRLHQESEFPGTGIGLANVRRIVERHNGHIWAESVLGKGATFMFTLA